MNSKYLYLSIVLLSAVVPFLASFNAKASFYKKWKPFGIAMLISGILFIVWDEIFTRYGIWGFNEKYVTGIYIGALPVEEILFFICIPYACVFTYFILNVFVERDYLFPHQELISGALIIGLLIAGIYNIDKAYTAVTFIVLSLYMAFITLKIRPRYMGRFYFAFGVILLPFLVINGILTGAFIEEEVVWYNDRAILAIRIGTIPLEDIFYAMLLLLMNISIYEWLQDRH